VAALYWHRIDADFYALFEEGQGPYRVLNPLQGVRAEIHETHLLVTDQPQYLVRVGDEERQVVTFELAVRIAEALATAGGDMIGNVPAW